MGVVIYSCPKCGAPLKFERGQKVSTCEHCGCQGEIEDAKARMKYDYKMKKLENKARFNELAIKYCIPAIVLLGGLILIYAMFVSF